MNRRRFIERSLSASAAFSALPLLSAVSRSRPYRLALIGCGWWGMNILREAMAYGDCQVVGLCDVDQLHLQAAHAEVGKLKGDQPKTYADFREMLRQEKPEIVIVGTPDHWHALNAIAAIESGAHVYLEKPISHTILEGKAILAAARAHDRVVQVGTHRRVSPHNLSGIKLLREGLAGEVNMVKCFVNYGQGSGRAPVETKVPDTLDWNMWCGPAPMQAYHPGIHPKGFRNYLNYANGTIADWGIHWFDQVLWWTEERYPRSVYSTGGVFQKQDGSDAPDTQLAVYDFESFTLYWEHKRCAPNANEDHNVGCYFYGTKGTFHMGWLDGWTFYPKNQKEKPIHQGPSLNDPDHQNIKELWADFRRAIEKKRRPVCDIEHGFLATNISLLGMLAYRLGRSVVWDGETHTIPDDAEAQALLRRDFRGEWEYPKF